MALAGSGPQPTGERQRLFGETSGLIDPPGPEIGRPRAQQNERRPVVNLTNAELLDGIRDQWERLVSPAAESVGGAEGSGKEWCPDDEMPRAAEVVAPLEDLGRPWDIPPTQVGKAEMEQPVIQREGMIGRFSDLHGRLGVRDGLVEPAELGEHIGEEGPGER